MKNKIRELREKHDLTQEQLAKKLEVSRQTIISIEVGRYNPSLILAYKLAQSFGCSIEDIFNFSDLEGEMNDE
ncbi:MAG: hypothetical protein JM58_03415 [Peptococcaceae bacterium BICA1-8]|nr:MAG: hypothetical protein JM58_03415 [Peptococcaceae bacterium BICA1-8]